MALGSSLYAIPNAVVHIVGVSPREVLADTTDIFTVTSSGLGNVGVGEVVYLTGYTDVHGDSTITGWAWEMTARPNGSNAALNDADDEFVKFTADILGTYRISFRVTNSDGQSGAVEQVINAANYSGVGGITGDPTRGQCSMCHDDFAATWNETRHSEALSIYLDGANDHFSSRCISCHTTGYNVDAANGGFDDLATDEGWALPDSLYEGNWDRMKESHPRTAGLANVQCESCHGPGSAHNGRTDDNRIAVSLQNDACAKCHDSGTHHVFPDQWDNSGHAHVTDHVQGPSRAACVKCHTGYGFVDEMKGVPDSLKNTDYLPITCATCHDPHDATNSHQLRTVAPYTLVNNVEVDAGLGNLCVNCHHARSNGATAVNGSVNSRFGPHHSNQGDMVKGTNAYEFGGEGIQRTPHLQVIDNACIGCHMEHTPTDVNHPGYGKVGGHSFALVSEDGVENVDACITCHGEIESFSDIRPEEDWDGDGTIEGVQDEIEGLMHAVEAMLPHDNEGNLYYANWLTPAQRYALYNLKFVEEDGSKGIHNPAYARSILQKSLEQDLGAWNEPVEVPGEFSLNEAYPNPFNAITTFSYAIPSDEFVSLKIFDMAGREIQTIVSENQKAGVYRAPVNLLGRPSGIYLVRMEAADFSASSKLVLVK